MKKTLAFMVMALALLLTQCKKPSITFPTPSVTTTVSMTITAGPGSKTDISTMGGIVWSENDKIYVGDGSKYVGYLSITSGVGNATGTFTGDVTLTDITEGTPQTFHFFYLGSGDYTSLKKGSSTSVDVDFSSQNIYNNGGNLENASAQHVGYGTANGTVSNGVVTGINVTLVSKVALAHFSFTKGGTGYSNVLTLSGTNIYKEMTVNFNSSTGFSFSGTTGNIALGSGNAERYVMLVPVGTESETLSFAGDGFAGSTTLGNGIEPNKFYGRDGAIEVVKPTPKFTVGMDGTTPRTVEFAPGNLYYDADDNECHWKFEANQYDFRTYNGKGSCINGTYNSGSGTPANDWGLFGWSTGVANNNWGMHTKTSSSAGYTDGNFKDWGGITDLPPAGEGKTWRTLSKDEWKYLMDTRTASTIGSTPNARYAEVKVNGVCGMMLFPDTFTWPSDVTTKPETINIYSENWNGFNYTIADFGKLETSGAVFLPAAGYRLGTDVGNVGSYGGYWSSTPGGSGRAYYVDFDSGDVYADYSSRSNGISVRLVR